MHVQPTEACAQRTSISRGHLKISSIAPCSTRPASRQAAGATDKYHVARGTDYLMSNWKKIWSNNAPIYMYLIMYILRNCREKLSDPARAESIRATGGKLLQESNDNQYDAKTQTRHATPCAGSPTRGCAPDDRRKNRTNRALLAT